MDDFVRLDSATYEQPDGSYVTYIVFEKEMSADTSVSVKVQKAALSTSRLL